MNEAVTSPPAGPGLRAAEVAERVARGQVNRVRRSDWAEYGDIVRRNLFTVFNVLVVPAALTLFALDEFGDAISVSGMIVTNTVLGLVQEVRAKRHLDRLTLLTETRARVVRDGREQEIPAGDVVLGDCLLLSAGEPIVADGPVLQARFLEVDEALLTGESDPVPRRPGDPVLSGSFCVAGEGAYRAERVGQESFAQHTAAEARSYRYTASPLQVSINRIIAVLTWSAVALCVGYAGLYLAGRVDLTDTVKMTAATITSMVPQGLVLMATLAFVLGAVRLSHVGALVQRLSAVESMASVDTLCLDKTGTLTTGRLHLERLRIVTTDLSEETVRARLRLFASVSLDRGNKSLLALRHALGEGAGELLDQLPFKSQNRYSAVRARDGEGEHLLVLGACESLRPFLEEGDSGAWESAWKELLAEGLRVLLFATGRPAMDNGRTEFAGSLQGYVLRPIALVALGDELRPEAPGVLRDLAGQGIRFKVISGDNPDTVRATVASLGEADEAPLRALAEGAVVSGAELEASANPGELIRTHAVFGRVSPWQKVEIVRALKEQGRQVAMIGDGVNDVLPIKAANLGIALGTGSRASKTVSGLVLENDDFRLLPRTLDEGRVILTNLRRASKLFLVKNAFAPILIIGALGVLGLPFPYLPRQVTLLNFLTIGVPALFITLGRPRSPGPARPDFLREVGSFALRTGAVIGAAGLLIQFLAARAWHEDELTQRTLLLSVLVLLGAVTLVRVLRDPSRTADGMPWLALPVVPIYLAVLYLPPAADFFKLTALTLIHWGRVLAIVLAASGLLLLDDLASQRRASKGP